MATLAKMGYVGYVLFKKTAQSGGALASDMSVRVTSADVKLKQDISYPDVVDNKIDTTLYQLGPMQVGGNITFPLVHEGRGLSTTGLAGHTGANCGADLDSLVARLWSLAAARDNVGRMANGFDCEIRYADNLSYLYRGCLLDSLQFTVNQGEPVNCTAEIVGGANTGSYASNIEYLRTEGSSGSMLTKMLSPARIVTWNDAVVQINFNVTDPSSPTFGADDLKLQSTEIREFTCSLKNNIDRFYTLNRRLGPQDIAAKKREISGTLKIMGHNQDFSNHTESNDNRYTSTSAIRFGYGVGANTYWATNLYGVVFEIEEVGLKTGLFETSTKWRAMGDCKNNYLAIDAASILGGAGAAYPQFRTNGK